MRIEEKKYQPPPNEYETIPNITAKCKHSSCGWQETGALEVEINSGATVTSSEVLRFCMQHHISTKRIRGGIGDHNQFFLLQKNEEVGFASVSSGGVMWHV